MALRKKLIVFKNYPTVLAKYVRRHQTFLKRLSAGQLVQTGFFNSRKRYQTDYAFYALTAGVLQPKHIEAFQKILIRKFSRLFRVWKWIRFTQMVTAKPREIRMGKGKGHFSFWSKTILIGTPLLEIGFKKLISPEFFFHIARRMRAKLPIKLGIYYRKPV